MEYTTSIAIPLFTRAESFEIGSRLGHNFSVQAEFNPSERLAIGCNVKVDSVGDFGRGGTSPAAAEQVGEEVEGGGYHV